MLNLKSKIFLILLIISARELTANYSTEIYYAYVNNRMDLWKNIIDNINSADNKPPDLILELVNYQYGYIGYCITFDKKKEAGEYLDLASENIEILENQKFKLSSVYAYKSAFYGMRIKLNALLTPYYGLKSMRYARLALELDSNNYLAWLQNGYIKLNSPASAGGSKKIGLSCYIKAREILEKDPDALKESWNYLNVLTIIAESFTVTGDFHEAKETYRYILQLEPGFAYVRDDLYPALLKRMKQ